MFLKPGTLRTATGGPGPERLMGRGGGGGPPEPGRRALGVAAAHAGGTPTFPSQHPFLCRLLPGGGAGPGPSSGSALGPSRGGGGGSGGGGGGGGGAGRATGPGLGGPGGDAPVGARSRTPPARGPAAALVSAFVTRHWAVEAAILAPAHAGRPPQA
jgi:hypothetical protein